METFEFIIENTDLDKRIDVFISQNLKDFSRTRIQSLIKSGNIKINDKPINKNYKLRLKDKVKVFVPSPENMDILPENIPLDIIYEDTELILVNKPQDMVVHPANGHSSKTLVNALLYHCKENLSGINGVMRPGIVHRIDKDTSGILIVAKNDTAHKSLANQLETHSMTRVYQAIVHKNLKDPIGTIIEPIGRDRKDRKKMAVTKTNSKNAVTHYKVLQRFKNYDFIELKLETGRTHQIRVHMSHIGHPILGDPLYGLKKQPFKLSGQTLHAKTLGFIHPKTNEYMEFDTSLPTYFQNILKKLN